MAIAKKMRGFTEKSSWIRRMFEEGAVMKQKHGAENVYDFSLGNPDVPPPAAFSEALSRVCRDQQPGVHGYMANGGYPFAREAVATRISREQGMTLSGNELLMTCGAAGAINITLKALLDPGDEVILLAPYFVEYDFYIDNHGGVSRVVETDSEFGLDFVAIEQAINAKTKAIIINSPNNPTGRVYSTDELQRLGALLRAAAEKRGAAIYLISDEPYRGIIFDGRICPGVFPVYRDSIIVGSHSKDLSLPGERIGFAAVHPEIEDKASLLAAMTLANRILGFVNAPALMQRVVAELQDAAAPRAVYARRRDVFCQVLQEAGFQFQRPQGAFYIFPPTPIEDDAKFCRILQEERILAVPGRGFGRPGHIRLAFCVSEQVIVGAAAGFKKAIENARN
ncbi:MAG: pyridoxal phosphate-dependent aminotransferase [Desulfobulbaceae bacterium]|jgi:aspartate aminotransferase|nr:pyridoxal phosphate-dependent aminotransferase [Desulfobulbaceae bacterium]